MNDQVELDRALESIRSGEQGGAIMICGSPGSGKRTFAAPVIAELAALHPVLVVSPLRIQLETWRDLLQACRPDLSVNVVDAQLVLELSERDAPQLGAGVYLATTGQIMRRLELRGLASAQFDTLVVDGIPTAIGRLASAISEVSAGVRQVIIFNDDFLITEPPFAQDISTIIVREPRPRVDITNLQRVPIAVPEEELRLEAAARGVLSRLGVPSPGTGRFELHSSLISALSREAEQPTPLADPSLIEDAWRLVDAIERLGPDPRVDALLAAVARVEGGPLFVLTGRLRSESNYVVSVLRHAGKEAMRFGEDATAERLGVSLSGHPIVVLTPAMVGAWDKWPTESTVIVWPASKPSTDARLLGFLAAAQNVIVLGDPTMADNLIRYADSQNEFLNDISQLPSDS